MIHLTVRFLGPCGRDRAAKIEAALPRLAAASESFELRATQWLLLPRPRSPRVLALETAASDALGALVEAAAGLEPVEDAGPARTYHPHLTLARLRRPRPPLRTGELPRPDGEATAPHRIDTLHLVESELRPDGARHRVIASAALGTDGCDEPVSPARP